MLDVLARHWDATFKRHSAAGHGRGGGSGGGDAELLEQGNLRSAAEAAK